MYSIWRCIQPLEPFLACPVALVEPLGDKELPLGAKKGPLEPVWLLLEPSEGQVSMGHVPEECRRTPYGINLVSSGWPL